MSASGKFNHQEEDFGALSEINVTPLVDVFLVLLVIFMITAPVIKTALEMGLPEAESAVADPSQGITILIKTDSTLWIDDERINLSVFPDRFRMIWAELDSTGRQKPVFLAAEIGVPYGQVVDVLDELRQAGVDDLGLLTRRVENGTRRRR